MYHFWKAIAIATRIVNYYVSTPKPIPKYSIGCVDFAGISGDNQAEMIIDKRGNLVELRKSTFDLSYKAIEVSESFKKVVESMNKLQIPIINNHD